MKNNLKKAISAVIALAVAGSMLPASFAAKLTLTDVPETADYAAAVNALIALNVVDGYEDNTFLPDNLITRAEASKIVVAALNETEAAEAMKGTTKFSDIEAKHEWATGYINKGVSMQYIDGDNGKFDPDGNVTYAQILKMMLCAMGYRDYAKSLADQYGYTGAQWYVPFTQLANETQINAGVYANPNDAVTRAQVAQVVYNAIKAPIVKNVGISYTSDGKVVPQVLVQNGLGEGAQSTYYRSILTEKFDAYYVEGYVTETSKAGVLTSGIVNFGIAKSERYLEEDVQFTKSILNMSLIVATDNTVGLEGAITDRVMNRVYVGETDAELYEGVYATAIIQVDDNDDWTILDFVPSGKNKSVKFSAKDLDDTEYRNSSNVLTQSQWTAIKNTDTPYLSFAPDGAKKSTKYMLDWATHSTDVPVDSDGDGVQDTDTNGDLVWNTVTTNSAAVEVYVNGIAATKSSDPIWDYVISAEVGEIELVDTYKTNGKYDTINVNTYVTGIVDNVTSAGKINLKESVTNDGGNNVSSFTLDPDNVKVEYNIYYNGEEIAIEDIQKNDVLSVAYNVNSVGSDDKTTFANSNFYEVYVSRDVVTDTLRGKEDEEDAAKFGDEYYEFITAGKYTTFDGNSKLGDEYTVYLDAFGRVFKAEKNSSIANWGVAENFAINSGAGDDDYKITIFTAEGTSKAYYVDATSTGLYDTTLKGVTDSHGTVYVSGAIATGNAKLANIWDRIWNAGTTWSTNPAGAQPTATSRKALTGRVVQYKVSNSTGKLTELTFVGNPVSTSTWVDADNDGVVDAGEGSLTQEFKARNGSMGSIKLGAATKIIDATKYSPSDRKLAAATIDSLTDGVEYEAYAYESKVEGIHPFVLVVDGEAKYTNKTRFAVITKTGYQEVEDENGDPIWSVAAMNGEATELLVADDVTGGETALNGLAIGDVIVFTTNAKGQVKEFDKLFSFDNAVVPATDEALAAMALVETDAGYATLNAGGDITVKANFTTPTDAYSADWTTLWKGANAGRDSSDAIRLIFAPIIDRTDRDVTFAIIDAAGQTDTAAVGTTESYEFSNDMRVYTYDYSVNPDYRFEYAGSSISGIVPTVVTDAMKTIGGTLGDVIDWTPTANQTDVNFGFAVVVDDEVQDILVFQCK